MIWAVGGNFKNTVVRQLDGMFRDYFSFLKIPLMDTVYEYFFDERTMNFFHWKDFVPKFEADVVKTSYFSLLVPTIDTMRYGKQLQILTSICKPVFMTGETGTGKSMIIQNFIS
jgi:dynein heavy chain